MERGWAYVAAGLSAALGFGPGRRPRLVQLDKLHALLRNDLRLCGQKRSCKHEKEDKSDKNDKDKEDKEKKDQEDKEDKEDQKDQKDQDEKDKEDKTDKKDKDDKEDKGRCARGLMMKILPCGTPTSWYDTESVERFPNPANTSTIHQSTIGQKMDTGAFVTSSRQVADK